MGWGGGGGGAWREEEVLFSVQTLIELGLTED